MASHPTISAIIPAYNAARYLDDAVRSIREQTVPIAEIIIVDDGSGDATAAVVRNFGADVRYLRQENAGPAVARNRGIEAACGDFVAFLDADDRWTPDKTATQLAQFERRGELALVASDMAETDAAGAVQIPSMLAKHGQLQEFESLAGRPIPNALAALLRENFIPTPTVMVRRAVLQAVGSFNPAIRYGEDLELWARIAARYPIACLPVVHLLRRRHGANVTHATLPMLEDLTRVMTIIDGWGAEAIREQGLNSKALVAGAWADLGYWHFANDQPTPARTAFARSLHARPSSRAMFYYTCCGLIPARFLPLLRRMKQHLGAKPRLSH